MRKFARTAVALVALALVPVGVALATPQKLTVPMDGVTVLNVCSTLPDVITLSGSATLTSDVRVGKDGSVSGKLSANFGGIKGAGLWGAYTANGTVEVPFKVKGPFPASINGPGHFYLLMPGSNNDLKLSVHVKFSVNGNGTISDPKIDIRQLECGTFDLV
jgi:hypothetical protein